MVSFRGLPGLALTVHSWLRSIAALVWVCQIHGLTPATLNNFCVMSAKAFKGRSILSEDSQSLLGAVEVVLGIVLR